MIIKYAIALAVVLIVAAFAAWAKCRTERSSLISQRRGFRSGSRSPRRRL